ncbi:hypothetical protein B0H14DRAFT_3480671 [Mycena olivaceomarginata]|nr:hypothetical protein B0H14DRAFT_3480671 [Mycena olivaceomarginata]
MAHLLAYHRHGLDPRVACSHFLQTLALARLPPHALPRLAGFITLAPASFPSPSVPALHIRSSTSAASTSTSATWCEPVPAPACKQLDAPNPTAPRCASAARSPSPRARRHRHHRSSPVPPRLRALQQAPNNLPNGVPRPPLRTPIPTDTDDFATDPTQLSLFASTSNSSTSLATLLSLSPQFAFRFPPAGVPSDVEDGDEGEDGGVWEEVELEEMEVEKGESGRVITTELWLSQQD